MVDGGLTAAYVGALLASAAVTLGVGIWAYVTTDVPERRQFLALMAADTVWTVVAAAELAVQDPTVTWVLAYLWAMLSPSIIGIWYVFVLLYTGRSPTRPRHLAALGLLVAAIVSVATNPWHGYFWPDTVYRSEPLSFLETTTGPLEAAMIVWLLVLIGFTIYYMGELFVKSRHRASTSLLVLMAGTVGSTVPLALTRLGLVPVPGYDHTTFGIGAFVLAAGYAIFGMGMFDIRPVARDNLVEEVEDALLVLDESGRVVDYNAASEKLSAGLSDGDPVGQPLSAVCEPVASAIELPDSEESRTTDIITIERDGETAHYSGRVTAITEKGDVAGYSVILRDVTERESYRRELEQRNEQLDRFASTVAHDLRTPMQVADSHAANLQETVSGSEPEPERVEETVSGIRSALGRMDDIITDLRTLAETGQPVEETTAVAFGSTVREAWRAVDADAATLEVDDTGTIEAQRSRLLSVLENLLRNSVEHGSTVRVGLTEEGFYVADDGPGIPEDERDTVFEYGYTDTEGGTGLGLAIVQSMANAHGWTVSIEDSERGGARFVVTDASTTVEDEAEINSLESTIPDGDFDGE